MIPHHFQFDRVGAQHLLEETAVFALQSPLLIDILAALNEIHRFVILLVEDVEADKVVDGGNVQPGAFRNPVRHCFKAVDQCLQRLFCF